MKDRTEALKQIRRASGEDGQMEPVYEVNKELEEFHKEADDIRNAIGEIEAKVDEIKKIHSEILSSPREDPKLKSKLDDLMAGVKKGATTVRNRMKKMEQNIEKLEQEQASTTDFRIRKTQYTMLSQKLVEVMTEYNRAQVEYRDRCKGRIQRQLEISGKSTTDEQVEEMLESGSAAVFTEGITTDTELARQQVADIEARHADILKLEASIKELHEMFMDMAMLVESQGEMIDRIEHHVCSAREDVEHALADTLKAAEYQRAARRKQLMMLACLAITCVILIWWLGSKFGLFD